MSSVFEAGILLACIVILHNWFRESILGTITAVWFAGVYMQYALQDALFYPYDSSSSQTKTISYWLAMMSFMLTAFYSVMAIVCWFFFYHHPAHAKVNLRAGNQSNFGFNTDSTYTTTFFSKAKAKKSESVDTRAFAEEMTTSNGALEGSNSATEKQSNKMDVTLIDAFRIKELNLLIISYILREAHDAFVKQCFLPEAQNIADANMQSRNYAIGAIVGIVSAGLIGDFFLRTKYFLQIFNINVVLLGLDVFLFF
jgi:hypothetical protein